MPGRMDVRLRAMAVNDVPLVLDVQEPAAKEGLADVFPQANYPFPRDAVARRWLEEIASSDVECFAVELDLDIVGFAAIRGAEFLHFGIGVEQWGSGVARAAHWLVVAQLRESGVRTPWLWVFSLNRRARRFYESLGWRPTGERSRSTFPPHPEMLRYELADLPR